LNAASGLNTESLFEAVEVKDPVFNAELSTEFRADATATWQSPRGSFRLGGVHSKTANSRVRSRTG
jgi:hypothetical protein